MAQKPKNKVVAPNTKSGNAPVSKQTSAAKTASAGAKANFSAKSVKPDLIEIEKEKIDLNFPAWLSEFKIQAIVIAILSLILYSNTVNNEYALDDTAVILKNEYVYKGFAGIGDILTKDAFDSYYKQFKTGNQLAGGRYRPLSIVTFAIEQQFLGTLHDSTKLDSMVTHSDEKGPIEKVVHRAMHVRHFFNILWFTLSMVVFLYFLRYVVFRSNPIMAFLAAILFTVHPIHTEVVANVKSRDEIMSLLFISLTFIHAFKYAETKLTKYLVYGLIFYFLAYLSKEYAITLMFLLPMAFFLFNPVVSERNSLMKCIKATLPFILVTVVYMLIRNSIVASMNPDSNADLLNNPYAAATKVEKLATEISTAMNYLKLLIFPHPLSADYSYNQIPYKDFSHWTVWLSLGVHGGLIYGFFRFLKQRNVLSFAIAIYLLHLLLVCNLIFDIGATMGERLIYHSSIGFCIAVAYLMYEGMKRIQPIMTGKIVIGGLLLIIVVMCSFTTIERNVQWKNNFTLFSHDIKHSPNSVIINANVASSYIDMSNVEPTDAKKYADLKIGVQLLQKTVSLHTTYVIGYFNLGLAYFKLGQLDTVGTHYADSAKTCFDFVVANYPKYPRLGEFYFNLGVLFYMRKQLPVAVKCWQTTLKIQPDNRDAIHALQVTGVMASPPPPKTQ